MLDTSRSIREFVCDYEACYRVVTENSHRVVYDSATKKAYCCRTCAIDHAVAEASRVGDFDEETVRELVSRRIKGMSLIDYIKTCKPTPISKMQEPKPIQRPSPTKPKSRR